MIGQTISHYPALWDSASKRDSPASWIPLQSGIPGKRNRKRNKILEKLGEVPKSPTSVLQRVVATLRIPPSLGGMGVVYKAQDIKLDRLVALKFQNRPRTLFADGCDFENPDALRRDLIGGRSRW